MITLNRKLILCLAAVFLTLPGLAFGEELSTDKLALFTANNTWMLVATVLVFIMHLGFACIEVGLTRSKNTVNILFKNFLIVAIGLLTYAFIGFGLMYPGKWQFIDKFLGFAGWGLSAGWESSKDLVTAFSYLTNDDGTGKGVYTYWTDFIFQGMFAATAATIVSGAVAERIKLSSFLIFSVFYVAIVYPIFGSWHWGAGWLAEAGFHDFAGSTLVHSVGGWGALVAIFLLGPRLGKYTKNGIQPILGHSMPLATTGCILLWFGWYGFNGGSVLSGDPIGVSYVFVTTTLGAAAGVIGSMVVAWVMLKKPDLSMVLNGALAGLVGITAGADVVNITNATLIGLIAGALVVFSVLFFDKVKLDDPVGALSVHLVCGIWGTLAVGIFPNLGDTQFTFMAQLKGVLACAAFCGIGAAVILIPIKAIIGLRVTEDEEREGLDISEHGNTAYPDFVEAASHL